MSAKASAHIDRIIEKAYYKTCSGIAIDIMDINKVFQKGREILRDAPGDTAALEQGIHAYVQTIRKN